MDLSTLVAFIILIPIMGLVPFVAIKMFIDDGGKKESLWKTILALIITLSILLFVFSRQPGWERLF